MRVKEYLHLARSQRRFGHLLASKYGLHFDPQYLNLYFQSVRVLSFYETKINIFFYRNRFADTLSFAFREYVTGEIGFNATEMTTSEIIDELTDREKIFKNEKHRDELMKVMRMWDMIKFAEAEFSSELLSENFEKCRSFAEMIARERESA